MQAITPRCDLVKTPVAFILQLCLCIFPAISVFAQNQQADFRNTYLQMTRTFHSADDFNRLTKGKVEIHRSPKWPHLDGELIGSSNGIVQRHSDGSLSPYP